MNIRKLRALVASAAFCLLLPAGALAAIDCTIASSPGTLNGAYAPGANLDVQGSLVLNCTRLRRDARNSTLWVGINQLAGETMAKPAPYADTLSYGIYRDAARTNLWTNGPAVGNGSGGLAVNLNFGTGNNTAQSVTVPVYMRAASGQMDKASGTYTDTLNVTVNQTSNTGPNLVTTTLTPQATVAKTCSFGVATAAYTLNYQAFRTTPVTDPSQSVALTCSKGTPFDLALDRTTGVIPVVQLTYGLVFTGSGTGAVSSTSMTGNAAQTFGLTLTVPGKSVV